MLWDRLPLSLPLLDCARDAGVEGADCTAGDDRDNGDSVKPSIECLNEMEGTEDRSEG